MNVNKAVYVYMINPQHTFNSRERESREKGKYIKHEAGIQTISILKACLFSFVFGDR